MPITGGGLISSSPGSRPGGGPPGDQTTIEGLSGIIDLDSVDDSIEITVSGQVINLCTLFNATSGALLEQKCRDLETLSGLITSPNTLGAKLPFSQASGTLFVMEHGLNALNFLWDMWKTDIDPIRVVIPDNVTPSGSNHVIVQLDTPMSGQLNLIGISD